MLYEVITNISTKSEPEMEKKGTPASPAIARASSVITSYSIHYTKLYEITHGQGILPFTGREQPDQHSVLSCLKVFLEAAGTTQVSADACQRGHATPS